MFLPSPPPCPNAPNTPPPAVHELIGHQAIHKYMLTAIWWIRDIYLQVNFLFAAQVIAHEKITTSSPHAPTMYSPFPSITNLSTRLFDHSVETSNDSRSNVSVEHLLSLPLEKHRSVVLYARFIQ